MRQGYTWDHWAGSLRLLRQVEHLILEVEFVPVREEFQVSPVPQDYFTGMNLKVIFCYSFCLPEICMPEACLSTRACFQRIRVARRWQDTIYSGAILMMRGQVVSRYRCSCVITVIIERVCRLCILNLLLHH